MRVAWVHSMRFQPRGSDVYSEAMVPYDTWRRYLRHFDTLVVVGRGPEKDGTLHAKYAERASGPGVTFELLDSLNAPAALLRNSRAVRQELARIVSAVDGLIARLPSEHGLAAIDVARRLNKPYAIELVGCAFDALWNHGDWRGKAYAPLMAWRVKRATDKAPFVLYVTREFLQKRYPAAHNHTGVSNVEISTSIAAISDVDIPVETSGTLIRQEPLRSPGRPLCIGMIGAFQNAYKGHEAALRAVKSLTEQRVAVELRLIGVGDASRWKALAQSLGVADKISFEGVLPPGEAVHRWLGNLELYIQPSLTEGLPRALIEAMACGRPALASAVGGIPELLEAECLHKPGDWKTLAEQIAKAANDPLWRTRQAARNKAEAQAYLAPVLDAKRAAFWATFASFCGDRAKRAA